MESEVGSIVKNSISIPRTGFPKSWYVQGFLR